MSVSTLRLNGEFTFQLFSPSSSHSSKLDEKEKQGHGKSVHLPVPAGAVSRGLSGGPRGFVWCHRIGLGLHPVCSLHQPRSSQHYQRSPDFSDSTSHPPLQTSEQWTTHIPPTSSGKGGFFVRHTVHYFLFFCILSTNTLPFPFVPSVGEALQWCSRLPADPLCFGVRWWTPGSAFSSALCVVSSQEQTAPQLSHPVLELHLCQLNQPHLPWWDQVKISRSFNLADIFWARTLLQLWFQGEMDKMLFTFCCQFFSLCGDKCINKFMIITQGRYNGKCFPSSQVGLQHLIDVVIIFPQTNSEPSEAEDPNHSSLLWGCQCSWWAQWTVFSELWQKLDLPPVLRF